MSTKAKTAKTVACAACASKDATIKRQCDELNGLATRHAYLRANVEGIGVRVFDHSIAYPAHFTTGVTALDDVARLTDENAKLQSRIDGFIEHSKKIREACVAGGVTYAEKVATLTAVEALAGQAKVVGARLIRLNQLESHNKVMADVLRSAGYTVDFTDGDNQMRVEKRRKASWWHVDACDSTVFSIAVAVATVAWSLVLVALLA